MNVDDEDNFTNYVVSSSSMPDQPLLLSDHVCLAVRDYVTRLDGEKITNLYGIIISEVERPLIKTVLELCGHNQSKAAQMLGLSRSTLRKKMTSYETL
jgi:Fis family transcriptional regulator